MKPKQKQRGKRVLDVIALGEALVDFLPVKGPGQKVRDVEEWRRCLGGAPANAMVGVARLGGKSALCGVTGDDELGHFIREELAREGVDVSRLGQTSEGKTGLGFVSLSATGERSFIFYRVNAAEFRMTKERLDRDFLATSKVLHFGTNSLLEPKAREAALLAAHEARARGQIVSCDPNLRLHIWKDPSVLRGLLNELLPLCSVVKLSDEEVEFVTGEKKPAAALEWLFDQGIALPLVTLGPKGAIARGVRVSAPKVRVLDTTGAGDGFLAGLLFQLTRRVKTHAELQTLDAQALEPMLAFACRVGSKVVTKLGAIEGLPRLSEVE